MTGHVERDVFRDLTGTVAGLVREWGPSCSATLFAHRVSEKKLTFGGGRR